jgi:hypothetical protein
MSSNSPFYRAGLDPGLLGMKIIENINAVSREQDWSRCRSPSRSRRRHAAGIKTRLIETLKPAAFTMGDNTLVAHPSFVASLMNEIAKQDRDPGNRPLLAPAFYQATVKLGA